MMPVRIMHPYSIVLAKQGSIRLDKAKQHLNVLVLSATRAGKYQIFSCIQISELK